MQEFAVARDADHIRFLGRANVGRIDEHFRHAQDSLFAVKIIDGEARNLYGPPRVKLRLHGHFAGIKRHRRGKGLEGRAHLIDARRHPVQPFFFHGIIWIVRVIVRQRCHRHDFARMHIQHHRARANRPVARHRQRQLVMQHMLHPAVDRELDGGQILFNRQSCVAQVRQAVLVDIFLHARDAAVIHIHQPDNMRGVGAAGIEPQLLGPKADARQAKRHDLALLLWRQLALEPHKPQPAFQFSVGLLLLKIRQHRG